jgi:hypothetical protein
MQSWNQQQAESFVSENSDFATTNILKTQGISGPSLSKLGGERGEEKLLQLGVTLSMADKLSGAVVRQILGFSSGVLPMYDPCASTFGTGKVWVNIFVEKVLAIDETAYEFEAKMWVFLSYRDDRTQYLPTTADMSSCKHELFSTSHEYNATVRPTTTCADPLRGNMDRSPLFFRNQKGEVSVLQDKLWVFDHPASMVISVQYLAVTFNTDMSFVDFPYDVQHLDMNVRTNWDMGTLDFIIDSVTLGDVKVPGWTAGSFGVTRHVEHLNETWQVRGSGHPMFYTLSDPTDPSVYESRHITIEVRRESNFYLVNMILPIWLLTMLSWAAFVVDPASIDVRMSMVLTIMLGFIAFQFVVNDNMPKSRYNTVYTRHCALDTMHCALT